jgi:hypothetical protein
MNLFLDNTFSTNHYISISEKIKKISMFFLYFNTIDQVKCLDKDYRKIVDKGLSNEQQRAIKYKILYFHDSYTTDDVNYTFLSPKFGKCVYHLFYSANILHENHLSFTMVHLNDGNDGNDGNGCDIVVNSPFVTHSNNSFPLLNDYSYSFYFPIINFRNAKLFFSRSLLTNPYVCIEVFLITYLLHLDIDVFTRDHLTIVSDLYMKDRVINDSEMSINSLESFIDYKRDTIVDHLLQFKYTWTYFSFCYFFILYYPEQLRDNGLYDMFLKYIQCSPIERNTTIVKDIHNKLFTI